MVATGDAQTERVTIYHIEGRRSFRVIWLCEELGIPYELVFRPADVLGSMVLSKNPYFGGAEFTAADIMMHYAVRGAKLPVWIDAADYPHIAEWKHKVESRPAFERAAEAALPGGSDEFGLPAGMPLPFSPPPQKGARVQINERTR